MNQVRKLLVLIYTSFTAFALRVVRSFSGYFQFKHHLLIFLPS
jgi:hypothetical protein